MRSSLPRAVVRRSVLALGGALGLLVAALAPQSAIAAGAMAFASHEARYDLRLISRAPGGAVTNARGSMTYRISDTCDGWAMESRTKLDLFYAQGDSVETDWSFISWESKDGSAYRFRVRSERDGRLHEEIDGRAVLDPGEGGTAFFTAPDEETMDLAPDVLLPVQHARLVLAQARAGKRLVTAPMFDGSEPGGAMQATAVVTEAVPAGATSELDGNALLEPASWRMVISFFAPDTQESLPAYEVRLRYHENGVAQEVIQDFGTMVLRAALTELTEITGDGCQ